MIDADGGKEFFASDFSALRAEGLVDLLEDFLILGNGLQGVVLVPRKNVNEELLINIKAALIASSLGIGSIDYVRKRYRKDLVSENSIDAEYKAFALYIEAYQLSKKYIYRIVNKIDPEKELDQLLGEYGASIVLSRLLASFFSVHLLYELGFRYEGHAVSRMILEQLAWAYEARGHNEMNRIAAIEPTKAIGKLKQLSIVYGKLYGYLSKKVHLDYQSHHEFVIVKDSQTSVLHTHHSHLEYAKVMMILADLFGVIWEITHEKYIDYPETFRKWRGTIKLIQKRPFASIMKQHLKRIADSISNGGNNMKPILINRK